MGRKSVSVKSLLKTDVDEFTTELQNMYDECKQVAAAIYEEHNPSVKSLNSERKQITSKNIQWDEYTGIPSDQQDLINLIINSGRKTFYAIAIASLAKKIDDPGQDIQIYSSDPDIIGAKLAEEGYPLNDFGRKIIHPFLRDNGFLESRVNGGSEYIPNSLNYQRYGQKWSRSFISDATPSYVFKALMRVLDNIRNNGANSKEYMKAFFMESAYRKIEIERSKVKVKSDIEVGRSKARSLIKEHLDFSYSDTVNVSALPVLAVWSTCKSRIEEENPNAILEMYNPHHATDSPSSPGDIIVKNKNGFMDAIDVKGHSKKLTAAYVKESYDKKIKEATEEHGLRTYYYIYCDEPDSDEKRKIENFADQVQDECDCTIRLVSMNDFLRYGLPRDGRKVLETYNDEIDANRYNELQPEHVEKLGEILDREEISVGSSRKKEAKGRSENVEKMSGSVFSRDVIDEDELEK